MVSRTGLTSVVLFAVTLGCAGANAQASETGTIRYAGSQYYPPLESLNNQGQAEGYISDLVRAMAASTGDSVEFTLQSWHAAQQSVLSQDADVIALIASNARSELYDFTTPFYYVAHSIFSHRSGPQFGSLEQLENQRVAFVRDSFAYGEIDTLPVPVNAIIVEHELTCLQLVANQEADACIEVTITSNHLAQIYRLPVQVTSPPFWPQAYVFAVRKGNTTLLDRLNTQLANIVVDGSYRDVYQKWASEIESKPHSTWDHLQYVIWLFVAIALLAVIFILWSWSLRQRVNERTRALSQELKKSQQLQERLSYTAAHDSATGLFNRTSFFEKLEERLQQTPHAATNDFTVITLSVVNVERIGITLGYITSLRTIKAVARILETIPDSVVAHFGSGLFGMIYGGAAPVEALVKDLEERQLADANGIEPQLAFGVSSYPSRTTVNLDANELIRRAMTGLAHARKKNIALGSYSPDIEPDSLNLRLLNDFQRVQCSQFVLHYQPQLDLRTNTITHVEALIRWHHPELGLLQPLKFIPIFEESGVIGKITRWVIAEAIAMLKRHNTDLQVSVNVTTRDLVDEDFLPFLQHKLQDFDTSRIVLEVTETGIFEDSGQAQHCIKALRQLGVQVAVDDFGTGYSSLSYLNDLAIQEVKIDRSFIAALKKKQRAQTIVRSTIALAKELGLDVVAEGVEDLETLQLVQALGADRIQGYYLAKPTAEDALDLSQLVRDHLDTLQ
ncbi:MAG: EAL domain-containing protein [Aliidiomarina sp.]|uniref:putative bifunctional diguanylate cyclase/phosphodiesterase n=1 Tax=Aliidiomarina sp. TaxID=1872439 RepID=UPI0025BBDB5C|nr:EAL domain-containing protein [Aliidiomarina sp.]MCH8501728.1 EAL domain-containing protein [Aliidiomarina sp.]